MKKNSKLSSQAELIETVLFESPQTSVSTSTVSNTPSKKRNNESIDLTLDEVEDNEIQLKKLKTLPLEIKNSSNLQTDSE